MERLKTDSVAKFAIRGPRIFPQKSFLYEIKSK